MKKAILVIVAAALFGTAAAQKPVTVSQEPANEQIFTVVEQEPEYPGGMEALYQFLAANVKYPKDAREENVQGRVIVSFVIEKDGSVTNIKVVKSPDERLSQEAVRVIESMPKWKPGKAQGKKVRVQFSLPINFKLD